jgi:23S rRNA (guanosine2251-2'-O)-methyltransferase
MVTFSPFGNKVVLSDLRRLWASLVTNNSLLTLESLDRTTLLPKGLKVTISQRSEIEHVLGKGYTHQGVCLKVEKNKNIDIGDFLKSINTELSNIIILDQLEDSQNVGAIFRSALAFKIDGIILTENQSVNENHFMTKTACGGIDKVPFTSVSNLSSALRTLKENGYWVYGLDGNSDKKITDTDFAKKSVFIFGSESDGMRHLTKSSCDEIVKIEISNNLESLNVSNSAAVLFFYLNNNIS